jgi:cobalt-zinc-cadmium efflux system outer membrane protein
MTVGGGVMRRLTRCAWIAIVIFGAAPRGALAQKALTWQQVRDQFEAANPTLRAGHIGVDEAKAQEITAYLRPNPDFNLSTDGTQIAPYQGVWQPFAGTQFSTGLSYLRERRNKRELRLESAQKATLVATSQLADQERALLLNLRNAFVQTLQQKAVAALATENLAYYDRVLGVSSDRYKAGDIAQVDLDRLELQRVQFETDLQSALVNLRTAKIQLLALLNDRTPIEQFDVVGPFEFTEQVVTLDELHKIALVNRPDLKAAMQAVDKAKTDYRLAVANGSTDPTLSTWWTHNPSFNNPFDNNTLGASVNIPLRIFDHNQGEKARTQLDIQRNERLQEASRTQVFSDTDSAFATLNSNRVLLRSYKSKYLNQATRVRDTVSFAYQHGGSSLLDFLNAQNDYRSVQLNYLNLVGTYMTAASQLNMAVGFEVIQ